MNKNLLERKFAVLTNNRESPRVSQDRSATKVKGGERR